MSHTSGSVAYRHPATFGELIDLALGRLDEQARQHLAQHVDECPECRADLDWVNQLLGITQADVPPEPPSWVIYRAKQLYTHWEVETVPRWDRWLAWVMDAHTLIATGVIVFGLLVLLGATYVWREIPTARTATVAKFKVPVALRELSDDAWLAATEGARVGAGARLRTGRQAWLQLAFPDGSLLRAGPNSLISIGALYTITGVGPLVVRLDQGRGEVVYQVASGPPGGSFSVGTPVALIHGRDTHYELEVGEDGTTRVAVLEGAVTIMAGQRSVRLEAGQQLVISPREPAAPLAPSPIPVTDTPTPAPTLTPTERPVMAPVRPTNTPIPLPTPTSPPPRPQPPAAPPPSATPTFMPTPSPTLTETPTLTPTLTPSPTYTPSPVPTSPPATPVPPTDTPQPTDTPMPTDTPVPTDTPMPPTPTPMPPTPTPVDTPVRFPTPLPETPLPTMPAP